VVTPLIGTIAPGVAVGTYVYTIPVVSGNSTGILTATKDPPPPATYSVSGKVTGATFVTITLLPTGKSVVTDGYGNYTFVGVPTGNYTAKAEKFGYNSYPNGRDIGVNNANSSGNDFVMSFASPTVEMCINVFYKDANVSGTTSCLVEGASTVPKALGTTRTMTASVQKPGESDFTYIVSGTLGPDASGYSSMQLYYGEGFYDVLPDGTKKYWASGIATFKIEITSETGEKTSVIAKVGVLMGSTLFGPLQQVTKVDAGLLIGGSFSSTPVAKIYNFIQEFPIRVSYTQVPENLIVKVPVEMTGPRYWLVVTSGFPHGESSSIEVTKLIIPQ
jgi:hypothetical protein